MKRFFKILGINIVVIVLLVVFGIVGVNSWLKSYTHHGESVKVPEVIGLLDDEAVYYIEQAGLTPMVIDSIYADAQPGSVVEQLPEGGIPVKNGRIIYLTINAKSVRMMTMPEVEDFSSRQARSLLREAGFLVDSIRKVPYDFDDLVREVQIKGVTAEPGREYPYHTHVTLVVGSTELEPEDNPEKEEAEDGWFE